MKITQQTKFQPITIAIETKEEAETLWKIIRYFDKTIMPLDLTNSERTFLVNISDWFSNSAQL